MVENDRVRRVLRVIVWPCGVEHVFNETRILLAAWRVSGQGMVTAGEGEVGGEACTHRGGIKALWNFEDLDYGWRRDCSQGAVWHVLVLGVGSLRDV